LLNFESRVRVLQSVFSDFIDDIIVVHVSVRGGLQRIVVGVFRSRQNPVFAWRLASVTHFFFSLRNKFLELLPYLDDFLIDLLGFVCL